MGSYVIDADPPAPWPGVQRDGFAYNPNTDTYYITEGGFSRVTRGASDDFIRHEFYATQPNDCNNPRGIVYEANTDTLLLLDDSTDRIYEFGLDGTYIVGGGTRTVEMPEDITSAAGIAFDPETGRIFITGKRRRSSDPVDRAKLVVLTPVIPVVFGDINGNGAVDRDDLLQLLNFRNQPADACPECDIDGDGVITVLDARKLVVMCTRPRCGLADCYGFEQPVSDLNAVIDFIALQTNLTFEYTPGPNHSTDVSFDLFLNDQFVANVGWIPPGGTSGEISLPAGMIQIGSNVIELKNPVCPPGVGSCVDGEIISWAGKVCLFP